MAYESLISLDKAIKFGAQYWDLVLDDFGQAEGTVFELYGNGRAAGISGEPLPAFRAVQIAPYSSIDRCELALSLPDGTPTGISTGAIPETVSALAALQTEGKPLFVRAAQGALFGTAYTGYTFSTPGTYANPDHTSGLVFPVGAASWSTPQLALRFFLRDPPAPTGRAPLYSNIGPTFDVPGDQADHIMAVWPIHGRNKIRVAIQHPASDVGGPDINVFVSVVYSLSNVLNGYGGLFETALAPISSGGSPSLGLALSPGGAIALGLTVGDSTNFDAAGLLTAIGEFPGASFLLLHAQTSDDLSGGTAPLNAQIYATD